MAYQTTKSLQSFFDSLVKQNQPVLVFDIETVPDMEKISQFYTEEELNEKEHMYQVSHGFHRIVSFAYVILTLSNNSEIFTISQPEILIAINQNDETNLLLSVSDLMSQYNKFVTFNGNAYDLPVLEKRSLYHGLAKKYSTEEERTKLKNLVTKCQQLQNESWSHFDMFQALNMRGQKGGLRLLASLVGLQKFNNLEGKEVQKLIESNDIDSFVNYSKQDALIEARLFVEIVRFFKK